MRGIERGLALGICVLAVLVCVSRIGLPGVIAASSDEAGAIAAGERLVHMLDCNVCHTPKLMTPEGPQPDEARLLSGHPSAEKLPTVPEGVVGPGGWGGLFSAGMTAWAGPWGVSFGSNLTPDGDTGIGGWTEEIFIEAMRKGVHVEEGRPFLPPMPTYARLSDEELHAIFTYLRSLAPVRNAVPNAHPPVPASTESRPR